MKRMLSMLLVLVVALLAAVPAMAEEPVKITVATIRIDEGSTAAYDWVVEQMKERYNIECEVIPYAGYYDQIKMAFEAGEIPTLVYVDDLWQQTFQKYGYFQDITSYVEEYGWLDKAVPGAIEFNNNRTPGQFYSVGTLMAPVVVYYNVDIFSELGLEEPKTYEELKEIMAKLKDAGYYSFEFNSDMFGIWWAMSSMIFTSCGMEDVNKWYYLEETTDAFKDALTFAANEVCEWRDSGYIREEILGVDGTTLIPMFSMGESAMFMTGDWDLASLEATGLNLDTFVFPAVNPDLPLYSVNATDGAWAVTTSASEAETDAAMKFIDLFFEQPEVELWVKAGFTPAVDWDPTQMELSPLKEDMMESVEGVGVGFYMDNAAPGMYDVASKTLQRLIGREVTAEEYVDELLSAYEECKANYLSTVE